MRVNAPLARCAIAAYFCLALLSGCAGSREWKHLPTRVDEERTVHVVSHGWHTGIVLARQDLGGELAFLDEHLPIRPFYEFGWGEEDFYQADEFRMALALKALFWRNPTVLHVVAMPSAPGEYFGGSTVSRLKLSATGLGQLRQALRGSFRFDPAEKPLPLKPGLYGDSRFFRADGVYHLLNTCNRWTARLLDEAGVPIDSALTLRAEGVLDQVNDAMRRYVCCPP